MGRGEDFRKCEDAGQEVKWIDEEFGEWGYSDIFRIQ
jgi:hypothetical protein